ncbi:hypothetical protein D3C75_959780 [compost metagenome]
MGRILWPLGAELDPVPVHGLAEAIRGCTGTRNEKAPHDGEALLWFCRWQPFQAAVVAFPFSPHADCYPYKVVRLPLRSFWASFICIGVPAQSTFREG